MASSKDKKKNKLAQSSASWLGVKPGQLNKNIQTANKTVQQAQKQNSAASRSNVQSSASWKGVTPSQVARPVQAAKPAQQQPKPSVVSLPTITPGRVSPAQQQRNAAQSARTLAQNDNSMRARIARSHEAERQRLAANAAAIKQDKSRLASNSLLWHQTTDASRRRQLEQENAAIRTRRGFGYDARTGSTFDTKGNELSLGARMIYGGKAETAKQFQQVAQTRDFVRDTSRTASQPTIYDVARGVQADDPYYALEAGAKAHNIVNGLLNRSGDTWTDADTKARDDARTALQNEMTALFRHYGVDYQPRWNEQQTADMLRRAGADEGTVTYAMENVHLRDSTDRLGQGLEAIGKRAVASIPSLIDTAKQALSNRNEDYENDEYRSLTEREQALEAQLQSMVSQNTDGSVPEDYQRVYDALQNVRNRANALKTTKGVNPNTWSQTMLREANEAQSNAEAGLAPAPRWLTEQAISLAGNAPSMAISALPGGTILGSALIGAQAAGQRTFELNEQGKSAGEALGRGLVSGVIEAATEKLPLEQMAEILRAGGTGAVKSILRQMGTEATEEGISYFLNYVSDRAASDPDAEFSLAELVQSVAGGAFGGLIFGAAGNVASRLALGDANAVPAEYDAGRYTRDVTAELQKADADLRAAKSLPEGAVRDRAIASAYQKMSETLDAFTSQQIAEKAEVRARERLLTEGMQVPERTAATAPVEVTAPKALDAAAQQAVERNRAAFDRARNIAERLGARFSVEDLGAAGGKYENGTITINPYTENPVQQVLVHELTHHLETSGTYNRLQAAALRAFSEEQGVSVDVLRQNITKLYADRGVTLDADGANRELAAAYCENRLFKDENSINRLAQTDVSLFQRIRQWISDLAVRLRGTSEQKRVLEVQRLYEKAARNLGQRARGVEGAQYQIQTLPDGKEDADSKPKFSGLVLQREYRQAVENGDMTRAHEILEQKATRRGYAGYDTTAEAQNHIIQNSNPVQDDYHTWIRDAGDVHTFAETLQDPDWRGMNFDPDYTWDMAQDALRSGEITVYSSYPIGTQGGFVTPSRMEAEGYAGDGNVYSKRVKTDDIAWIDPTQGQYAPVEPGNVYKHGLPYAKSLDVTYDDAGRLIPLSRRFDESRTDSRYSLGYSTREIAHPNIMQDAVQYGKTPEQAVYEAKVKREGEQVRAARKPALDTDGGLYEQPQQPMSIHPSEYINDQNRDFFSKVGAGNDRLPSDTQKTIFKQDMSRVKWLSDTDYQARHEHAAELRTAWEQVRQLDRQIEKFKERNPISDAEERLLQSTLINRQTNAFNDTDKPEVFMHLYELANERKTLMEPLREYSQARREALELNAQETADKIAAYAKDKSIAAAYSRETMERNSYDIFGKDHTREAEELNSNYYEPVHKAVADKTKYVNSLKERVAKMHLNKHESAMVQMLMEGEYGGIAEYAKNNHIDLTPQLGTKLKKAAQEFRLMYNDMYERISDTLISNGMWDSIPGYLKNYAPHFTLDAPQNMLQRIRFALDLGKDSTLTLRTDLAGITDEFRPGKKWFGNLLHREGEITDYDAVAGFERYINTAGDVIFLTDSVQNLRTLEDAIRYRLSDDGTREQISKIRNDISLDPLTRYQELDKAYNVDDTDSVHKLLAQKRAGMTGYVSNLREYINNLAGKKSKADRGWEDMLGRQMYNVARNVEGRVAANMIAANPGSWITNFIPITQMTGEVSTPNLLRAMRDTVTSAIKDDGFEDASAFLTNRRGTERLTQTATQRASEIMGKPMECIDMLTSNVVVRGKYLENIQHGMDVQSAFEDADRFAANLMADRSQGAMPTAFNAVNPIRKIFTVFQLEVNNQLSYLFKDLPRAKQSASKLAWAYTKVFVGAYAFNKIYHELTGRDSAFDPIGMIADAFGQLTDDDEDDKKKRALNAATSLGSSIAENLPFIGGVLGGGRVPVSSAIPDVPGWLSELNQGYDSKRLTQDAAKELAKPATYLLLPFGGGAVNRAVQGYMTVKNGGSYRYDKNGEKMLQFPVFGQKPEDWAKAMLFGKSSLTEAQNWKDNGYDSLYAKETEAFDTLRERMKWHGEDNSEAVYAAIKAIRAFKDEAKGIIGDNESSSYYDYAAAPSREMLMRNNDLTLAQKEYLDKTLIGGDKTGDYSSEDAFYISQNVRETRQDTALEAAKHGVTPDVFAQYDNLLQSLDDEVDENGDALYNTNQKIGAVMAQVNQDEDLTDGEKQAVAGYVLITAMNKSDREKYADLARGYINPSDYVRFKGDLADYKKEFEGTDTDHNANVKRIIDGYSDLNDKQKSVLMSVYSNKGNNLFHVSTYEAQMDKSGSFYKGLTEDGRDELRTMLNDYESDVGDGTTLEDWKAKAYMAEKEAGISPSTYALYQLALQTAKGNKKSASQDAAVAAVKAMDGLTQSQQAYLYQSTNLSWKKNPFGSATVTKYDSGKEGGINPVEGSVVTSPFGPRQTFTTSNGATSSKNHHSIDLAAAVGTPIKAFESGKVTANGWVDGYGWTIEVTHPNGLISQYHHMQNQSGVAIGTEVKQGEQIGSVGSTGNSTGPHLDLSIIKDGKYIDPASVIPSLKESATGYVSQDAASYGSLTTAAQKSSTGSSKKSGGSGRSGGTSWSGLKNLKKLPTFK